MKSMIYVQHNIKHHVICPACRNNISYVDGSLPSFDEIAVYDSRKKAEEAGWRTTANKKYDQYGDGVWVCPECVLNEVDNGDHTIFPDILPDFMR